MNLTDEQQQLVAELRLRAAEEAFARAVGDGDEVAVADAWQSVLDERALSQE